jgi:tRNA1(Val) A37 N6-methylase TrmN6
METSADFKFFCVAARDALNPANPHAFVAIIHDGAQLKRVLSGCKAAGLTVVESRLVMHRVNVPTGRVLVRAIRTVPGDENQCSAQATVSEPLVLHPEGCKTNLYGDDIEDFLAALASPTYGIGRTEYAGSDQLLA